MFIDSRYLIFLFRSIN